MSTRDDARAAVEGTLYKGLDRAVTLSRPVVLRHLAQTRRSRPDAAPAAVVSALGKRFTAAVATTGAMSGAAAAAPAVALPASLTLALMDGGAFTVAAGLYVFSLAEIHGVPVHDLERRRTLLLGILLGDTGSRTINEMAARTGQRWAGHLVSAVPTSTLKQINKVLGRNFVTRYGTRQGILVLGKQVPFGVGGAIGGAGNAVLSRLTIKASSRAFGPAPTQWPEHLQDDLTDAEAPAGQSPTTEVA